MMMRNLLQRCSNADNYMDCTLGHTQHCDDHIVTLRGSFTRIRDAGLTLKRLIFFGFESIPFIGYVAGKGIM